MAGIGEKAFTEALDRTLEAKEDSVDKVPALLGAYVNGQKTIIVEDRRDYVWCRVKGNTSEVVKAFNAHAGGVGHHWDLPILIAKDNINPDIWKVMGRDVRRYATWETTGDLPQSSPYLVPHGRDHSFSAQAGMGADPVWVFKRQMMPLLPHPAPTGTMGIEIGSDFYYARGHYRWFNSTGTIDLDGFKPTGATDGRFVTIYIDAQTGNPAYLTGTEINVITPPIDPGEYIPIPTFDQGVAVAAIFLLTGTARIGWGEIYDLRQPHTPVPFTGTAISIYDESVLQGGIDHFNFVGGSVQAIVSGTIAHIVHAAPGGADQLGVFGLDDGVPLGTGTSIDWGYGLNASLSGTVLAPSLDMEPDYIWGGDHQFSGSTTTFWNTVGIGTSTVPHGGIGWAKAAIDGPPSSADGPHVQFTVTGSNYPVMQVLNLDHDNAAILFDGYYEGAWRSSYGSTFRIYKVADQLDFGMETGLAAGMGATYLSLINLNENGVVINAQAVAPFDFRAVGTTRSHLLFAQASTNRVGVNTSAPAALLHVSGTFLHQGLADFDGHVHINEDLNVTGTVVGGIGFRASGGRIYYFGTGNEYLNYDGTQFNFAFAGLGYLAIRATDMAYGFAAQAFAAYQNGGFRVGRYANAWNPGQDNLGVVGDATVSGSAYIVEDGFIGGDVHVTGTLNLGDGDHRGEVLQMATGTATLSRVVRVEYLDSPVPYEDWNDIDVSNLLIWARSDMGITKDANNIVSVWENQQGNNFSGSTGPTWIERSVLNGYPVLSFNPADSERLLTADYVGTGSAGRTLMAVVAFPTNLTTADALEHMLHYGNQLQDQAYGITLQLTASEVFWSNHYWVNNFSTKIDPTSTSRAVVMMAYDGTVDRFWINGQLVDRTRTITLNTGNGEGLNIGSRIGGAEYGRFSMAEVAAWNTYLSGADRRRAFLAAGRRYKIRVADMGF